MTDISMASSDPGVLNAYIKAVRGYRPWHQHHWNSTGNDAFGQLISGGLENGFFTKEAALSMFGVSEKVLDSWITPDPKTNKTVIPDRKIRIKAWKAIKECLGMYDVKGDAVMSFQDVAPPAYQRPVSPALRPAGMQPA